MSLLPLPRNTSPVPDVTYTLLEGPLLAIPLEGQSGPLSDAAAAQVRRNAKAIASLQAEANVGRLTREREDAAQRAATTTARFTIAEGRERAATRAWDATSAPAWLQHTFYAGCVAIALAGEYVLSYQTLPPLLGVPLDGWLAVAIGAAPVAATIAIELLLDATMAALQRGQTRSDTRGLRLLAVTTLGLLVLGALALNAEMIWRVALAREEASRLLALLTQYTDTPVAIDQSVVTGAVLAVSFVVAINAALLLRVVLRDSHEIGQRLVAGGRTRIARFLLRRAQGQALAAQAALATATAAWERRVEVIHAVTEAYLAKVEYQLQRLHDEHPVPALSLEDAVDRALVASEVPADVFAFGPGRLSMTRH